MARHGPEVIICIILLFTTGILYLFNSIAINISIIHQSREEYEWILRGFINLLGYSTVLLPGFLVFKYVRKINYLDRGNSALFIKIVRRCFGEEELTDKINVATSTATHQKTNAQLAVLLVFYFVGLQVSFLSWGVLQEKAMTQKYINGNKEGHFKDSQFLVFVNRILAFLMSSTVLLFSRKPKSRCPLYKYVFCSISNIVSSWCQYEALKYVSFPHQVLAKASKPIPVMIMGKIVSKTKYEFYEYLTAVILSIGMLLFMLDTSTTNKTTITTFSGVILLLVYIVFDSFTSNWQGALFKQFNMSPVQMMCGVNLCSCIFTAVSLLQQGSFSESIKFMVDFPLFIFDCLLLSVCSAAGQLFIFSTISTFGPLVFAIISTVRQGFAVFLSCLIYKHHIDALGIIGVLLVFFSIFLRIYCSFRLKNIKKKVIHNSSSLKL